MPLFDERRKLRPRPGTPPFLPEVGTESPVPLTPPMMPPSLARPSINRQSRGEEIGEARDAYLEKTPSRLKSGALGALSGFLSGGGLAGAIMGGASGAIDPRGLRKQQFNQRIRPQIEERFKFEDMDRAQQAQEASAQQQGVFDQARLQGMAADTDLKLSQAAKNRRPEPVKALTPSWKLGRNRATGQFKWFDAADPTQAGEHEPHVQQPSETPVFRVDQNGNYVDVRKAAKEGKQVKAFQRPRAAAKPKEAQKFASITDVREAATKAGKTESQMKALFREKGYTIVN